MSEDENPEGEGRGGKLAGLPAPVLVIGGLVTATATGTYYIYLSVQDNLNADCVFHQGRVDSLGLEATRRSQQFIDEWCQTNPGLIEALDMFLKGFGG